MKKQISAEIIADSISPQGHRITSFILTYPRFIHSELMTHRMFSRNSASSRAIPFEKMVQMVEEDPFTPIAWQKDHSGMQGTEYFTDKSEIDILKDNWMTAKDRAVTMTKELHLNGLTKQLCNRLLEPFMWHTVLVTATEYDGFFALRCPQYSFGKNTDNPKLWKSRKDAIKDFPDWETRNDFFWSSINNSQAEIHMQALAEAMYDAYNESTPKELKSGEWHIPFGDKVEGSKIVELHYKLNNIPIDNAVIVKSTDYKIKIATARCARLSYMTFDGEIDYEKDIELHDRLLKNKHASAFEHCCRVLTNEEYNTLGKMIVNSEKDFIFEKGWVDNFRGFISYRRILNI